MEDLSRCCPFRAKGEDLGSSQWHSQKVGVFRRTTLFLEPSGTVEMQTGWKRKEHFGFWALQMVSWGWYSQRD